LLIQQDLNFSTEEGLLNHNIPCNLSYENKGLWIQ